MKQPAIVIVTYNRPHSLKRLLHSVLLAHYSGYRDIFLIISIDGGGNKDVAAVAEAFDWKYGQKEIIKYPVNLGLRNHIISCGDLSEKYESVIILEDDCIVSRNFYDYSCNALTYYDDDERIAGIALYSNRYNEYATLPFDPVYDGNEVFFMQVPCSWGQAWTKKQWQGFKTFYNTNPIISSQDKMPESAKEWSEKSWKKYFFKYIVNKNLYFVYPTISYSTNFADIGEHWNYPFSFFQVPLEAKSNKHVEFVSFDESHNKYDAYLEILPECLISFGVDIDDDICIDMYGTKQFDLIENKYLLSTKKCNKAIKSYGVDLNPVWYNLIYDISGKIISYSTKKKFEPIVPASTKKRNTEETSGLGYHFATKTRYYKLGYYLLHPAEFIRKRVKRIK